MTKQFVITNQEFGKPFNPPEDYEFHSVAPTQKMFEVMVIWETEDTGRTRRAACWCGVDRRTTEPTHPHTPPEPQIHDVRIVEMPLTDENTYD